MGRDQLANNGGSVSTLKVPFGEATRVAAQLITSFPVKDFTIEEVPLEEALSQMFTSSGDAADAAQTCPTQPAQAS